MAIFHWKIQRISAILLVPIIIYLAVYLLNLENISYSEVREDVSSFWGIIIISFSAIVLYTHSSLGIEIILEDYIHDLNRQRFFVNLSKLIHAILLGLTLITLIIIKGNYL